MSEELVRRLASYLGGKIEEVVGPLPDGSGFAVMSMPLPKDHWLYKEGYDEPPMPLRMGVDEECLFVIKGRRDVPLIWSREEIAERIRAAVRYGYRGASMNGKENDIDPDALVQNVVVGLLGYWTSDGHSHL